MDPTEGHDGFCFTAGFKAAVTGAGTTHACLASRRAAPQVVAGISLGALNAAAMQRAYREIAEAAERPAAGQESARWTWFRRYVDALANDPNQLLWKAVPDQSDFFADMIPIADTPIPGKLKHEESQARKRLYLKVKLGRWLAQLPISVRLVAAALVNYVRFRERYPFQQRAMSLARLAGNGAWLAFLLILRVAVSPQFFPEHEFPKKERAADADRVAHMIKPGWPIFGWLNLFSAIAAALVVVVAAVQDAVRTSPFTVRAAWDVMDVPLMVLASMAVVVVISNRFREPLKRWLPIKVLAPLVRTAAHGYSGLNAFCVAVMAVAGALVAHAAAYQPQAPWAATDLMMWTFDTWKIASLMFAAAIIVPAIREGFVTAGVLRLLPRPLFGWGTFVGAWINLVSLTGTFALFVFLLVRVLAGHDTARGLVVFVEVLVLSCFMLVVPLPIPLLLLGRLWRRMRKSSIVTVKGKRWAGWVVTVLVGAALFLVAALSFAVPSYLLHRVLAANGFDGARDGVWWRLFLATTFVLMTTWFFSMATVTQPLTRRWFLLSLLKRVGLRHSLISDYHLLVALRYLFGRPDADPLDPATAPHVDGGPGYPAALIVAAPLQKLHQNGVARPADQLWAGQRTSICYALRCALSAPPIFSPVRIKDSDLQRWLKDKVRKDPANANQFEDGIDLVDGSVIRQNPLPALFGFLRHKPMAKDMADHNSRERPAIHVVYGVPIEHRPPEEDGTPAIKNTIVDVGLASLRLSQRRDTQLEVMQTNVIAKLESMTPPRDQDSPTYSVFADEIAPGSDVVFDSELNPSRDSILSGMAAGCRRTLQKLYGPELRAYPGYRDPKGAIACGAFLRWMKPGEAIDLAAPGLPEVCGHCSRGLEPPVEQVGRSTASIETLLSEPEELCVEHPQLTRADGPRIVFIASGGVFRGAFHIGMLAALKEARVKPDLIVGASVGTLMGGALGRLFTDEHARTLEKLVTVFMEVDTRVALTRTLKNAVRELGLRGRSVKLSPRRIRRLVMRGGRGDPGFAATGAPSALIDAISDLFMIPHGQTREIAAKFVAGHVGDAVDQFLRQVRTETIRRLEIERALIGSSLIEQVAADLLTDGTVAGRVVRQPFQESAGIAFYGTATNLMTQSAVLLGGKRRFPGRSFDFVEAALASSAFPTVFPPRAESLVFPGRGHPEILFADGGMFDNLPFFPALELLSHGQYGYRKTGAAGTTVGEFLESRLDAPDLLIAGALDPTPETDNEDQGTYDSIDAVQRRAVSLKKTVKIRAFELASWRVCGQLMSLRADPPAWMNERAPHFVDKIVNAGVMPVFPTSREHLNGTFSFCASTGLKGIRIEKSIADGCFQTLRTLADQQAAQSHPRLASDPALLATRGIAALTAANRIAAISAASSAESHRGPGRACPYFLKDAAPFACPFTLRAVPKSDSDPPPRDMTGIFDACARDPEHRKANRPRSAPMSPQDTPRNLVVLSDGTGNSAAKLFKTNVWRLYDALDLVDTTQVALYDDGVGTASFKPLAILGGAFGHGLKRNVIDLYMFLCRNYRPGDRIFAFGFSRGAFTAQVVTALVCREGLIKDVKDDVELKRLACWAYRRYRKDRYRDTFGVSVLRSIRNGLLRLWQVRKPRYEDVQKNKPDVTFLGVWDTVAAYGLPMDELTRGWDRWIWPMLPRQRKLSDKVKRACHAVAIDDERQTFFPLLWDEAEEKVNATSGQLADERLSQVWFAGAHSNVGGGYADDSLSFGPLCWIAREAQAKGLRFRKDLLRPGTPIPVEWTERAAAVAPMGDARRGAGAYYRYHPRPMARLCDDPTTEVKIARPKVHESVFHRVADARDGYAPIVLPKTYAVVDGTGRILSGDANATPPATAPNPFEHSTQAAARANLQETAWNVVWHRRVVYFGTVAATLLMLFKPLIPWFNDLARTLDQNATLKSVVEVVGTFVPGFADGWLDHYRSHPTQLVAGGLIIGLLMWRSSILKRRIVSRMGVIWRQQGLVAAPVQPAAVPTTWVYRLRTSGAYVGFFTFLSQKFWPTLFGVATLILLLLVLPVRAGFSGMSRAGSFCREFKQVGSMEFAFHPSEICHVTDLQVEQGATYVVDVAVPSSCQGTPDELRRIGTWHDAGVAVDSPAGFPSSTGLVFRLAVPFRRMLTQKWFVPMVSIGEALPEHHALSARRNTFVAGRSGPLTMYVNDAVAPVLVFGDTGHWLCTGWDCFYRNNGGGPARVRVTRSETNKPLPEELTPFSCDEQKKIMAKQ